ncbi:MAG: DinB family protein [Saprospiraceae bacterium]|nr:DinB family protein [Saprospiraceae bacterium]
MKKIPKPAVGDYAPYFQNYMNQVPEDGNLLTHLKDIQKEMEQLVLSLPEEKLTYRYAEGKWTIKDILVHLMDAERIFIYRALRFARADETPLAGFDENVYVPVANADARKIKSILKEGITLRASTIEFIKTLDRKALKRKGLSNNNPITVLTLVNLVYGHQRHHMNIIKERYL